jgi:hypothetical protein
VDTPPVPDVVALLEGWPPVPDDDGNALPVKQALNAAARASGTEAAAVRRRRSMTSW